MPKRVKRTFRFLLVLVLAATLYVGWARVTDRELPGPFQRIIDSGRPVVGTDDFFSDLRVTQNDSGLFDGTITVQNTGGTFQDVLLTVELFDGEQNVGTLVGSVALKPNSSSSADLFSMDPYVSWTDAHVDLMR